MSARPSVIGLRRNTSFVTGVMIAGFGAVAGWAVVKLNGTKTGLVLALASVFGPVSIYYALTAPLIFPYGLYVVVVPFDYAMSLTAFGTITKLLGVAAGASLIIYLIRKREAMKPPPVFLIWAALVVWTTMTAFWAIDVPTVLSMLPTLAELLLLYAAVCIYPSNRRDVYFVLGATLAGGLIASGWGVYLFHAGQDIVGNRLVFGLTQPGLAPTNSIDPNQFSAGLLLPTALALVGALSIRRFVWKAAFGAGFLLLLAGIAVAGSRGAMVALAVMVIFLFIRGRWRLELAALMSLAGIVSIFLANEIWARFNNETVATGSGRIEIWKVALIAMKSHLLLGAGYYNFPYAYNQAVLLAHTGEFVRWFAAAHDLLFSTIVELGIIGLVLTLVGWYGQFRMLRIVSPGNQDYPIRLALEAATLGLFVAALFLDMMPTKYVWLTFMVSALFYNLHRRTECAIDSSRMPSQVSVRTRSLASPSRYGTAG